MTLTIRRATVDDIDALVAFNAAMARETEDLALDTDRLRAGVRHLLEDSHEGHYRVAEAPEAGIVGALMITFEWSDWRNGRFWWIQSVYVSPEWRGRGVYRALHRAVRDEAVRQPDVCGLRLYVERANTRAQAVYRGAGMHETHYLLYEEQFDDSRDV
jgi:ribosomal protein S18 acetylase RimI-like enzyme